LDQSHQWTTTFDRTEQFVGNYGIRILHTYGSQLSRIQILTQQLRKSIPSKRGRNAASFLEGNGVN